MVSGEGERGGGAGGCGMWSSERTPTGWQRGWRVLLRRYRARPGWLRWSGGRPRTSGWVKQAAGTLLWLRTLWRPQMFSTTEMPCAQRGGGASSQRTGKSWRLHRHRTAARSLDSPRPQPAHHTPRTWAEAACASMSLPLASPMQ